MFLSSPSKLLPKILTLLSFVLLANLFLFHQLGGSALALFIVALFVLLSFLFPVFLADQKKRNLWFGFAGYIVLVALSLIKTPNSFPNVVAFLSGFFVLGAYLYIASKNILFIRSLMEMVLMPVITAFTYLTAIGKTIEAILNKNALRNESKSSSPTRIPWVSLATGLVISIPVLFVLLGLLTAADPVYGNFINNVFHFLLKGQLWQRLIFSLILFISLLPLLFYKAKPEFISPLESYSRYSMITEITVVMVVTALVLGSFLIVQWSYVFVSVPFETDLSRFGVATYSEYVRRGFIELLMAAGWIYGLVWLGLIAMRNKVKGLNLTVLRNIQLFVLVELALFIASVFRRIWLYQSFHGWSLIRIYGGIILIWIAGMTVFLTLRHKWGKRWIIPETIFTGLLVIFILFFNAEHFIATTHPPTVNKRVDYLYLSRMSADGYQGWQQSFAYAKEKLQTNLGKTFLAKDDRREVTYGGIVVSNLTLKYRDLVEHYGSREDKINFYTSLFDYQEEANQKMAAWAANTQQEEATKNRILSDLTTDNNTIKQLRETIPTGKFQDISKYLSWSHLYPTGSFDIPFTTFSFVDIAEPNTNYFYSKGKEYDALDKVYTWNLAEVSAFNQMKQEITIQELLNLQKTYFELYRRILAQPNGQQDYETDVSLNTPLL